MNETEITLVYPTPILKQTCEDAPSVNAGLKAAILERARPPTGATKSNVGGWHSETDVFDWPVPEVRTLLGWVGKATKSMMSATSRMPGVTGDLEAWAWANVLYDGGYNLPHLHADCMWSGVYYVDVGEPDPDSELCGVLELMDPRPGIDILKVPGMPFSGGFRVEPRDGLMVMFPSWLYHFVRPYHGSRPRISVAFNLRIVDTNLPDGVVGGAISYPLMKTSDPG